MAIIDEIKGAFQVVLHVVKELFTFERKQSQQYLKIGLFIFVATAAGAAAYFGYRWYTVSNEQKAFHALADTMQDYQMALKMDKKGEWDRLNSVASFAYSKHKSSALAPLFLAIQADAQIKQQQFAQALETLQQVINGLPENSPLLPLYKTKKALILCDSSDEALQKNGVELLVTLARDKENEQKDLALFYLGRYYWAHDNVTEAKSAWQELADSAIMEKAYPSAWAREAKMALKQLG